MQTSEETETSPSQTNVGDPERWVSVVTGSALAAYGLKRRSIFGTAIAAIGGALVWRGATGQCPVYKTLDISTADGGASNVSVAYGRGIRVERSITINATPERLFAYWRDFENLPRFMEHLESVVVTGPNRSHWIAKGPAGVKAEWDAEVINEVPNELIGWRSVEGSRVDNAGSVTFKRATGDRGTTIKVLLRYDPPGGIVGATLAKLFGQDPQHQVTEDLRRLKQIIEAGEVPTTEGQSSGREA